MARRHKEGLLPFKVVAAREPLIARGGLIFPYELAKALKLPDVVDEKLPRPGSGRGYRSSQLVNTLILVFYGGGKNSGRGTCQLALMP